MVLENTILKQKDFFDPALNLKKDKSYYLVLILQKQQSVYCILHLLL